MKILDYRIQGLKYILAYLRQNKDVTVLLKNLVRRFNLVQDVILYLLKTYSIRQARGIWLDYAGSEVGAQRDEMDYGNYFTVNRTYINVPKQFYFMSSGLDPKSPITLDDAEFMQKIYSYIGTNCGTATIEDVISIIKTATNASNVLFSTGNDGGIKIKLDGTTLILTKNTISYVQQILSDGIYLEELSK